MSLQTRGLADRYCSRMSSLIRLTRSNVTSGSLVQEYLDPYNREMVWHDDGLRETWLEKV